jgi:phospholipase C
MKRFDAYILSVALVGVAGCSSSVTTPPVAHPTSPPSNSIQHIVILLQENRSFDNLFAGFPGADAATQGMCKPGPSWCKTAHEVPLKAIALAEGSPSLGGMDICHSHQCVEIECDPDSSKVCRNDGFDLIDFGESQDGPPAKLYPYAYVRRSDTKPYWNLAEQYALADQMFFTETASSFIAHQIVLSGSVALNDHESLTDQPDAMPWGCDAPQGTTTAIIFRNGYVNEFGGPFPCFTQYGTIADLLDAKGVSWLFYVDAFEGRYYDFSGTVWNGFDAIKKIRYGPDWKKNISIPNTNIFADVKAGRLPAVSWVIPTLYDSDHPASGCNGGPWWVTKVVNALGTSQYWKNTAIVLLWDDWGGWYDNVPPPQVNYTSLGFRVPMIVISPYAKPHYISHTQLDFGSLLKLIEENFGLGSLGTTDATANSMSDIFDFTQTPNAFKAAPLPPVESCGTQQADPTVTRRVIDRDRGIPE